jgi:hypothetical protein
VTIKTATKIVYLICILGLVFIPLVTWIFDAQRDLTGIGAFCAGIGVPLGTLTVAMAMRGNSKDKNGGTHE